MNPDVIFAYVERKAGESPDIDHDPAQDKKAFFVIDDPYDFDEFDEALRNASSFPAMLCELVNGKLDDNDNANYTNSVNMSFMIVDRPRGDESRRDCKNRCFAIGKEILRAMRKDVPFGIVEGKRTDFRVNSNYQPVGPLDAQYWGYQFDMSFVLPMNSC